MKDFRTLKVWEQAHMLTQSVYMLMEECPGLVRYGLAPQMRRASTSIAANIAEGCGRSGNDGAEQWYFNAAMGSAASLEYHVLLAHDLALIPDDYYEWFHQMTVDIEGMLRSLLTKEKTTASRSPASLTLVQ
jgi:four helix bundle protein